MDAPLHTFDWLADVPGNYEDTDIVEIQFKNTRKGYYRNSNAIPLKKGDIVAVEASFLRRGERDRIKEAGFHRQASVPILPTNRIGLNTERAVPSRNILPPYLSLQNIVED